MASDSLDSRRKHRRSPSDDESHERSKRHKHRHHRRHHRRHHKHSSKKHDDEMEASTEKVEVSEDRGGFIKLEESHDKAVSKGIVDYDDVEEGEILEEGEIVSGEVEIGGDKGGLDIASGEIKASDLDNSSTGAANGDVVHQSIKDSFRTHGRYKSPEGERSKQEDKIGVEGEEQNLEYVDVNEGKPRCGVDSKYRRSNGSRHERSSFSPPQRKYSEELVDRNKLNSSEYLRKQSHSHNEWDDRKYNIDEIEHESDDEKLIICKGSDLLKKDYREKGCSGSRHDMLEFVCRDHESGYGDRVEAYGDQTMKKDHDKSRSLERAKRQESSRYKDHEKVKDREKVQRQSHDVISNGVLDKDKGPEEDRRQSRERVYEKERRNSIKDLHRDSRMERDLEKDRGRVQEREYERDRRRDSSRASYRDRDVQRVQEKENDRGRSSERDYVRERRRDSSWASYRDRDTEREREESSDIKSGREREVDRSRRDRYGDKLRDAEIDRAGRYRRYDNHDDEYGERARYRDSRRHRFDGEEYHGDKMREDCLEKNYSSKDDFKASKNKLNRNEDGQKDYEVVELRSPQEEEEDIEKIKEESRRRKEAILQKYKAKQQQQAENQIKTEEKEPIKELAKVIPQTAMIDARLDNNDTKGQRGQVLDANDADKAFSLGKSPPQSGIAAGDKHSGAGGLGEGTPKSERSNDMFCDDIFGDSPAGTRKAGKGDGLTVESSGLRDNWDDPEGYYSYRFGEILDGRYEIVATHGKGVFSTVVRAKDLKAGIGDPDEVAIKLIRNNETMLKAGMEELIILKKLVGADPDDRRHCVRFISSFKYRNHLCLVFESLHMNLREVLKKFGRNIGLKLTAVRAYAKQLFIALKHLRNCGVLHCDIKPDNMLVNDAKNVLKLCDFGNAMFAGKNEITPYLVSRFYRAPEIILGLPYDHPVDIWSVGCCLYELYTGKVLFPGSTNNDMLRLHMELKGSFPKKMLRKGGFIDHHFDQDLNFLATEEDPITKRAIRKLILNIKPKDIGTIIKGFPGEDPKMLANFKDLLEKIFVLDPDKRLTVSQALSHPFITGK